ncbi:MAG: zinc ribbon domain-containing protein [bacterium]
MIYSAYKKDGNMGKKTDCKHDSLPARRFCSICGQSLPSRICYCGHINIPEASYCEYCGSLLEDTDNTQPKSTRFSPRECPGKYLLPQLLDEAEGDKISSYPQHKENEILSQAHIKALFKKKRSQPVENEE